MSIHTTPEARAPMMEQSAATLIAGVGIEGDRYAKGIDTGTYSAQPDVREVTLIEVETLEALARDHDITLDAIEHRRNLTTRDVPLNHLVGRRFRVGDVVLEGGRLNTPCRYIDMITKKAICDLLEHRSGLNCRIITGGTIRPGDAIHMA
ncbi:MOSC domain-containing protein [Tateyamaria armeniaca]|uniref:MOSC domain-containing protein n=1 Tax=Tateyamaria armeniaca TaxID=2518930 RepID=A0ABW8UV02_9RHOB